jgi:hypothetical protein
VDTVVGDDEGSRRVKDDDVEKACDGDNAASDDAIMKRVVRKFIVSSYSIVSSSPSILLFFPFPTNVFVALTSSTPPDAGTRAASTQPQKQPTYVSQ